MIHLLPSDLDIVKSVLKRRVPDCAVWAFGSRVNGTPRPFSDLDLAIVSRAPLSLGVLAELAEDFDESSLSFKVDLLDWASTDPSFRARISQCREPIQVSNFT